MNEHCFSVVSHQIPDWTVNPYLYIIFAEQSTPNGKYCFPLKCTTKCFCESSVSAASLNSEYKKYKKKENVVNATCVQENAGRAWRL